MDSDDLDHVDTTGNPRVEAMQRGSDLLWNGLPDSDRGPKRALSLHQIVEAAVKTADEAGIDALSMRCIARALGVGTMTLYRYVPDKSTLLDLVLDHLIAPTEAWDVTELPGDGPAWRRAMTLSAREGRALYLAHPWLIQINWSRPAFGPNTIAGFEAFVAHMHDLSVSDRQRINIISALDAYVTGAVRAQLMYQNAPYETGLSDEEYWTMQQPVLERAMHTGAYPTLATMDEDSFSGDWDEVFELGLTAMLDGVAARFDPPA